MSERNNNLKACHKARCDQLNETKVNGSVQCISIKVTEVRVKLLQILTGRGIFAWVDKASSKPSYSRSKKVFRI